MLYRMFGCPKLHPKQKLAFDPAHLIANEKRFTECNWYDFYCGATEATPGEDMPISQGNPMSTHCFVDASHGSIIWYSKQHNTVEASTFGSKFQAMKNAIELIEALRHKLQMFGVPIDGPTNIFCDNKAVSMNTTLPESTLKKAPFHCVSSMSGSSGGKDRESCKGGCGYERKRLIHEATTATTT